MAQGHEQPAATAHPDSASAFWIGRRLAGASRLPFVLRLPVAGEGRVFLAAREDWPRASDVFCLQLDAWPDDAEVVSEVPIEACWRQGAAIHLVLRRRENRRSLFVWTKKQGRTLVFWRSAASMQRARPGIRVPLGRSFEERLTIAVDARERYPWRFTRHGAMTERRRLPAGDYALVRDDTVVAVVERKTAKDLATATTTGQLALLLADLAQARYAALVVEGRLSDALKAADAGKVRPGWLLNLITTLQVTHPTVVWTFAETRQLAEDWAYRWLAACSRADATPYAIPLLDERALGEASFAPAREPRLLDSAARRALLRREASEGTEWTSRTAAERCGVSKVTAAADLAALVRAGLLAVNGRGRARKYRTAVAVGDLRP